MAEDSIQASQVASDPGLASRVKLLLSEVCATVLAESAGTPNHDDRVAYAQRALNALDSESRRVATIAVSSAINVAAGVSSHHGLTDAQISNAITNNFNTLAGIDTGS
jgi:hypothetical protein